jgi:acyl-CoA reductase-like NAD-dependent aldehyde dehydrogenase
MTAPTATRLLDNYVAGAWTPASADAEALDVTNPATGDVLARVRRGARIAVALPRKRPADDVGRVDLAIRG